MQCTTHSAQVHKSIEINVQLHPEEHTQVRTQQNQWTLELKISVRAHKYSDRTTWRSLSFHHVDPGSCIRQGSLEE